MDLGALTGPFSIALPGDFLYKHLYMGPLICNPIEDNNTLWNYSFSLAAFMLYILQAWQSQQR